MILRLRGQTNLGATLVEVLANYASKLRDGNGRLYLTGISEEAHKKLMHTGRLRLTDSTHVYEATPVRGQSTHDAYTDAQTWLVGLSEDAGNSLPPDDGTQ